MKICFIALFLMFATWLASGQTVGPGLVYYVTSAPSGACSANSPLYVVIGSGDVYSCGGGVWTLVGPGGGGGGANVHLSNLVAPTAISVPLIVTSQSHSNPPIQFLQDAGLNNPGAGIVSIEAPSGVTPCLYFYSNSLGAQNICGVSGGGLNIAPGTGGSAALNFQDNSDTVRVLIDTSGNTELGNPAPSAGAPTGAEYTEVAGATGYLTTPALNGVVFGTASETVQQAMTATAGGMAQVPASSAATDNPLGTQINSILTPSSSSQTAGTQLVDYRYGTESDSCFNPNFAQFGNFAFCHSIVENLTQPLVASTQGSAYGLGVQQNVYDGGMNISDNGYIEKANYAPLVAIHNGWTQGQHIGIGSTVNGYGAGDVLPLDATANCFGGSNANSDEGCEIIDMALNGGNVAVVGTISSGAATGSTSLTLSISAGSATQGSGRPFLDTTQKTTGTVTTITGSGPILLTFSGTPFTASTNTTSSSGITAPGSATLDVGSTTGITANTTLVSVADSAGGDRECVIPTAVSAGVSITATFRFPHPTGATVAWGGQVCNYVELNVDRWTTTGPIGFTNVLNTLRLAQPIISNTTSVLTVWNAVAGGYGGSYAGNALASAGSNAATVYPGAEVVSVQANGTVSNTITLAPNNVAWATSDAVEIPLGPMQKIGLGNWQVFKPFFTPNGQAFGMGYTLNGNANGGDCFFCITDNAANTLYTGHGGNEVVPLAFLHFLTGLVRYGLAFDEFPDVALVNSACPVNTSGSVDCTLNSNFNYKVLNVNGNNGYDYFAHNPSTGAWELVTAGAANGFVFDGSGYFSAQTGYKISSASATSGHYLRGNGTAYVDSTIQVGDVPDVSLPTPGSTCTFSGPSYYCVCTTTCTITVPVPAAGVQYCALNDDNVSTVITLSAIGSSARYENTARTAYGTAGTGTFVSGGAVGDKACIVGRDSTHYLTLSFTGTWTAN